MLKILIIWASRGKQGAEVGGFLFRGFLFVCLKDKNALN